MQSSIITMELLWTNRQKKTFLLRNLKELNLSSKLKTSRSSTFSGADIAITLLTMMSFSLISTIKIKNKPLIET